MGVMSQRAIIHVDMDAFYASVEVRDDPSLAGKPVIVGGTPEGRGVVAAASYEAREYGIHSAMSAFRAKKLCPHAVFIRPRMRHYSSVSKQIFAIFREYTPLVEPISIDEAFLDVTGSLSLFGPAEEIGRTIKRRIRETIGLTASVGVAPNKFLAKLASDLEKPDGFVIIKAEEAISRLAPLPVGKLWGVGKVTQKKLISHGIPTIKDLRDFPTGKLETIVGSQARRLRDLANGIDNRPVAVGEESKSIGAETTFPKDIYDAERLMEVLDSLVERVAKRLRKEGYRAHAVHLKARYPDFKTVTRVVTLPAATASTKKIQETVRELFEKRLDRQDRPLRLVGVSTSQLVRAKKDELELFPDDQEEQREKVDHLLDELQKRYGSQTIWRGKRRAADKD
ncbi:MAG: DNA polymerase IV [Candidatus Latescibacterota bacterium]|nr:MAG: DNA polymerase IV [Candidatus Latescibacterota bacterium]